MSGAGQGWADVVYGRTFTADFWWRAVPSWASRRGWLEEMVRSVVGGGHGLAERSRFILARGVDGTLVGAACRARALSDTMHSDGQRALFCFVGWLHPPVGRIVDVPALEELEQRFPEWAAPTYARWMAPAWQEHPSRLREPVPSRPGPAPWAPHAPPFDLVERRPGSVLLHPAQRRGDVWDDAQRAVTDFAVVTGWAAHRDGVTAGVTDVCADDVDVDTPSSVEAPRPVVAPPLVERRPPTPHRSRPLEQPPIPEAAPPRGREPSLRGRFERFARTLAPWNDPQEPRADRRRERPDAPPEWSWHPDDVAAGAVPPAAEFGYDDEQAAEPPPPRSRADLVGRHEHVDPHDVTEEQLPDFGEFDRKDR